MLWPLHHTSVSSPDGSAVGFFGKLRLLLDSPPFANSDLVKFDALKLVVLARMMLQIQIQNQGVKIGQHPARGSLFLASYKKRRWGWRAQAEASKRARRTVPKGEGTGSVSWIVAPVQIDRSTFELTPGLGGLEGCAGVRVD